MVRWSVAGALAAAALLASAAHAASPAPGAPGAAPTFAPADKHGFGTAHGTASPVWFTLRANEMSEVYFPDLGTPATRGLELVVSDGRRVERESRAATGTVERLDGRGLTYRQVTTSRAGGWRATKTYITDPRRTTVRVDVRLESLRGRRLTAWVLFDPQLSNDGSDDRGSRRGHTLVASDAEAASALRASPAFTRLSSGYVGRGGGWHALLRRETDAPADGNVQQAARTRLTGRAGGRHVQLALSFGATRDAALRNGELTLRRSFGAIADDYARAWQQYLASLRPAPAVADRRLYDTSLMVLAGVEDKRHLGASIASPSMPWAWGDLSIEKPTGVYHMVWARDLYQVATAQLAAGDAAAAGRLLDFLLTRQQKPDGSFPQNSDVTGKEHWTEDQLDQTAFPIVLAWQLGRTDAATWAAVRRAAEYLVKTGPRTGQERWENQAGWSPGTIAAEIAGLTCAADLARANGDAEAAARYQAVADGWAADVEAWTATATGPYAPTRYYLRVTKDRAPDKGTTYNIGDSGPAQADQRTVVDPSFLELVRLGVKPWDDPVIRTSLDVVDAVLGVDTPGGQLWHRFTFDGYGETQRGGPWKIGEPDTFRTFGRAWPIFAGERGEYELLAGVDPAPRLRTIEAAANDGLLLPEQVWDGRAPTGRPGFPAGEGTFSATPLAWTHAQYVRLALSVEAGRPVEQPAVVACRYTGRCG